MVGQLEFSGGTSYLKSLSFRACLDGGWSGQAVLEECWSGAARGATATILVGNQRFDIVVKDFDTPWSNSQHQWISFADPASCTEPFVSESFFSDEMVSYADVIASRRLAVHASGELSKPRFSQVAIDGLRTTDVLREICAEQGWHWYWHDGRLAIGPLPDTEAIELTDTSNEGNCDGGFGTDVHLVIPKLGERVKVRSHGAAGPEPFREGYVTSIDIELPARPLSARLGILEEPRSPSPISTGTQRIATVRSLAPLQVEIDEVPEVQIRGQLMGLRSKHCQIDVPVHVGDRVVVDWPRGDLTRGLLRVHAEDEVKITVDALKLRASHFDVSAEQMNVIASEVNFDEP